MNLAALVVAGMMALGGASAEPTVTGNGQQTVKLMPDTMEMTIDLTATEEQSDKALASIQQQWADIEKALRGLPAAPSQITTEGPWRGPVPSAGGPAELQRRLMMEALGRANPQDEEEEGKVTLSMTGTARWKLSAREPLALLKETEALRDAVRAALPKPASAPDVAATEDQIEAMLRAAARASGADRPSGAPTFAFTAALPADKAAEATQQAFRKARQQAESLAAAAGVKLGALRQLSGDVEPVGQGQSDDSYGTVVPAPADEPDDLARGTQARALTFKVSVTAEFDILPGQ